MEHTEELVPRSGNRGDDAATRHVQELLARADVRLGGDRPWDIRLRDASVPARVLALGSLGLGEAYMDGHWECDRIDQLFDRLLRARLDKEVRTWSTFFHHLRAKV